MWVWEFTYTRFLAITYLLISFWPVKTFLIFYCAYFKSFIRKYCTQSKGKTLHTLISVAR